jgi:hypothetical protein
MWVRKFSDTKMYDGAGVEVNSIVAGSVGSSPVYSAPGRVLGAKSLSFVFKGVTGGPLAAGVLMVSHAESPSLRGDSADWVVAGTIGTGLGYASAAITGGTVFTDGGGVQFTGYPLSATTAAAGGSCITARWARLRLTNGVASGAADLTISGVTAAVMFDGDAAPVVVRGSGCVTKAVLYQPSCSATLGNTFITPTTGDFSSLKDGSLVKYQSGLPVVSGGGPLYARKVATEDFFRLVTAPLSETYLTIPSTFSAKVIDIYNLELSPDANTL